MILQVLLDPERLAAHVAGKLVLRRLGVVDSDVLGEVALVVGHVLALLAGVGDLLPGVLVALVDVAAEDALLVEAAAADVAEEVADLMKIETF